MPNCKTIAICNQKGGTGKTTTTVNLGIGLAKQGKKVLLVDADPHGDLTTCLGWKDNDSLPTTITNKLSEIMREENGNPHFGILHHEENVDLLPANLELSAMEMMLVTTMSRETVLRTYLNKVKNDYEYILIDCMPSLGMVTLNALAAADSVIIPVQAQYLPAKGMTQLTAIRYVVPANQTAPVKWKEVTTRNFTNILKKFTVTVTKSDREEGIAQGDASLAGAVYGIYKGETLVDKYVTDKNGQFTTKEYVCDNDWTIREITPSEGYLLDTTIHKVGAEPQLYTVEHNQTANDVNEQVIKGNIAIIKHTDDGETKIETPESGATFEIYLKSAGSYTASEEDERDIIVCDENGFGQTKDTFGNITRLDNVYSHIIDEDRRLNAQRFEETFYQKKNPSEVNGATVEPKKEPQGITEEAMLNYMVQNPDFLQKFKVLLGVGN